GRVGRRSPVPAVSSRAPRQVPARRPETPPTATGPDRGASGRRGVAGHGRRCRGDSWGHPPFFGSSPRVGGTREITVERRAGSRPCGRLDPSTQTAGTGLRSPPRLSRGYGPRRTLLVVRSRRGPR